MKSVILLITFFIIVIPLPTSADVIDAALLSFSNIAEDDIKYVRLLGSEEKGLVICVWLYDGSVLTKTLKHSKPNYFYDNDSGNNVIENNYMYAFGDLNYEQMQKLSVGEVIEAGYKIINRPTWTIKKQLPDDSWYFEEALDLLRLYQILIPVKREEDTSYIIDFMKDGIRESAKRNESNLIAELKKLERLLQKINRSSEYLVFIDELMAINPNAKLQD